MLGVEVCRNIDFVDMVHREFKSGDPGQEIGPIIQAQENDTEEEPLGQSMPRIRECAPTSALKTADIEPGQ